MKNILVTGADGFLGKNFIRKLPANQYTAYKFLGDITSPNEIEVFLKSIPPIDFTYHFAGISSPAICTQDPDLAIKVNITGALNLAQSLAQKSPGSTFVFPSTGQVYRSTSSGEILTESSAIEPVSFYAETKLNAEDKLLEISNLHVVVLRLFNHAHKSQDPNFFLPSLYKQISSKATKIKTGNLNLIRDFGAIQDLIPALLSMLQHQAKKTDIYNMCSGTGKSLKKIAEQLALQMHQQVEWIQDDNLLRKNEPLAIIGSSNKFQSEYNWIPTHSKNEQDLVENFLQDF